VWIADFAKHTVTNWDAHGKPLGVQWGTPDKAGTKTTGSEVMQFGNVADIAFGKGSSVYIADGDTGFNSSAANLLNHRFSKLEKKGGHFSGKVSARLRVHACSERPE
jgi:hypothetical protein